MRRTLTEAVSTGVTVGFQGRRPEELGQFTGGGSSLQVHLEEPVLGMQEPQRHGRVGTGGRADRRHTEGVALDFNRILKPGEYQTAIQPRQAAPQQDRTGRRNESDQGDHRDQEDGQRAADTNGHASSGFRGVWRCWWNRSCTADYS